jgi:Zn-dependent protease with chaperone function
MQYENRQPDETVNYSTEHPLKEFAWLVFGLLGVVIVAATVLGFFAGEFAARVPFSVENDYARRITEHWQNKPRDAEAQAARAALRDIAGKLAAVMQLPPGMTVHAHYSPDGIPNAFATLGGNVVLYRGLVEKFDSEDAVALVMAHEIAHAKLRHPASSLGRGIAVGLTLSLISAGVGEGAAGGALQTAGTLPLLKYSRDQESNADAAALAALAAVYGHVGGARDAFSVMSRLAAPGAPQVAVLRTHPLTAERIAAVDRIAAERGWKLDGERRPLPPALARLKTDKSSKPEK